MQASVIFFGWLFRLKRDEWWKRDKDTFKLDFYPQVYSYLMEWNVFSQTSKIAILLVEDLRGSFFLALEIPYFQARVDCPSCSKPLGRLLFFVFNYFILCLFYFIFSYDLMFYLLFNPHEYSRFEQRSIIKFLVTEKGKPCEIYWRICDVYRKACFS